MGTALLIARLALAGVFAAAGVAKLADREGSRRAASDFGVPQALAGLVALALPVAELAVALFLLPAASAPWAAAGALVLLLAFAVAIGVSVARGRAPDCHCFGQLHSEPAGWRTLARNLALAALAGFVTFVAWRDDAGTSASSWIGRLDTSGRAAVGAAAAATVLALAAAWLALQALRGQGRLLVRLERLEAAIASDGLVDLSAEQEPGLAIGSPAPGFSVPTTDGDEVTLAGLIAAAKPVVLLFTDPGCGPCQALMPDVARWQREHADALTVALVSGGPALDSQAKAEEHALELVLADEERTLYELYAGTGTPSAVLIGLDGRIESSLAAGSDAILHLVNHAIGDFASEWGIPIGEPVPEVALRDLDGRAASLADYRGADTLFLFWSPSCGFCREMHEELLEWEADRPPDAPRLVVVASGEEGEIRDEGFASPVLVDAEGEASRALRFAGTPSAVLVDSGGRVAWPLAVGSEHVLRLLRSRTTARVGS